jgi:hypothetical protein
MAASISPCTCVTYPSATISCDVMLAKIYTLDVTGKLSRMTGNRSGKRVSAALQVHRKAPGSIARDRGMS